MKTLLPLVCFITILNATVLNAQVNVGSTSTPNSSAMLQVTSTNKGVLLPNVSLQNGTDATTIASPATGLVVWNTNTTMGIGIYTNTGTPTSPVWQKLSTSTATNGNTGNNGITSNTVTTVINSNTPTNSVVSLGYLSVRYNGTTTGQNPLQYSQNSGSSTWSVVSGYFVGSGSNITSFPYINTTTATGAWNNIYNNMQPSNNDGVFATIYLPQFGKFYRVSAVSNNNLTSPTVAAGISITIEALN